MAETTGNIAVSLGGPGDHAACDTEIARLRRYLDSVATQLPVIRHALEFTRGHGEAKVDCRVALEALDEVWPF